MLQASISPPLQWGFEYQSLAPSSLCHTDWLGGLEDISKLWRKVCVFKCACLKVGEGFMEALLKPRSNINYSL